MKVHSPGLLNSAPMDNPMQTTKSLSALSAKRNVPDPPGFCHEETAAITLFLTPEGSELALTLRPVR